MSAIPKKKLCWNCEGNIVLDADNCPYCGVYVHSPEIDQANDWSSSYYSEENNQEEVPKPVYQLHPEQAEDEQPTETLDQAVKDSINYNSLFEQVKKDILPTMLLMCGSIFFLFALVLLLFSSNGTLTLQWSERLWPYFISVALISFYFGWKYLLKIEE